MKRIRFKEVICIFIIVLSCSYGFLDLTDRCSSNQYLSVRRVSNAAVLFDKNGIKLLINEFAPGVKAMVLDVDKTVTEGPGITVDNEMVVLIRQLTDCGIHVAFMTGGGFERIDRALLSRLDINEFNHSYLHVYLNMGAEGYGFGLAYV